MKWERYRQLYADLILGVLGLSASTLFLSMAWWFWRQ
jgi:hypothetical protein